MRERSALPASLGAIRKVAVEYLQGWLSQPIETTGQKQAAWRADPALNGPGGCIGDIGTHAFHLVEYVTWLEVTEHQRCVAHSRPRAASWTTTAMRSFVWKAEQAATLMASQMAAGERNGLRLRVYGEKGSLEWHQEDPNRLQREMARRPGGDSPRGRWLS